MISSTAAHVRNARRPSIGVAKLFRTTAFKLSFAYLAVFATIAFVGLGYVAWNASRALDGSVRGRGVNSRTALAGIGVAIGPCG